VWTRLSCVSCRTLNTALLFPGHADAPPPISCTNHLCSLQADINREADEFEAQLRESRQRMEADRAAFAAWERETAAARSAGHFLKSLYQSESEAPASASLTSDDVRIWQSDVPRCWQCKDGQVPGNTLAFTSAHVRFGLRRGCYRCILAIRLLLCFC